MTRRAPGHRLGGRRFPRPDRRRRLHRRPRRRRRAAGRDAPLRRPERPPSGSAGSPASARRTSRGPPWQRRSSPRSALRPAGPTPPPPAAHRHEPLTMVRLPTRRLLAPLTLAYHGVNTIDPGRQRHGLVMAPALPGVPSPLPAAPRLPFPTAEELAATGRPQARGTAVLTFDDGWRDALTGRPAADASACARPSTSTPASGAQPPARHRRRRPAAERRRGARAGRRRGHGARRALDAPRRPAHARRRRRWPPTSPTARPRSRSSPARPAPTLAYPFGAYDERVQRVTAAPGTRSRGPGCRARGRRWPRRACPARRARAPRGWRSR